MNALFLLGETLKEFGGISMKILSQINGLERLGFKVILSDIKADNKNKFTGRYVGEEIIDRYSNITFIGKIQSRIKYKNLYRYIKASGITLVYIRYVHFANPFFISFLKKLKRHEVKVLLEIPTYPYDQEYQQLKAIPRLIMAIEKRSRWQFKDLVTCIITFTPETKIFGVPAIEINNGIETNSIKIAEKREANEEIHLIGTASIAYWHGYDRVIEGLRNYYLHKSKKKIVFHIVGDTPGGESMRYYDMVNKYRLSAYVKFHGKKFGKDLDALFNNADIAVGCLGCHRKGMEFSKSLKNREYSARGLPFFYSETDIDFEGKDFIFKVPANDNPIDIDQIIHFVESNKFDRVKIRNYAIENLTWERQFEKVLAFVFPEFIAKPISRQDDKKPFESQAIQRDEKIQAAKK